MAGASGRVAVVLGTRPEIVKLAGVTRLLGPRGYLIHSGQHYDDVLSTAFFSNYDLPAPAVQLDVGGRSRSAQYAGIITALDQRFAIERPSAVVVQGDTNTAAAAALAADFAGIPVVHVEAGLRSYDRAMPEEINRKLIGSVAALHCAPTTTSARNLVGEGVDPADVIVTGNTVVEAVRETMPDRRRRAQLLRSHALVPDGYVLATVHRPENTDDPTRLTAIVAALEEVSMPVVLPLHPRTQAQAASAGLDDRLRRLSVIEPVDHPTFLALAQHARLLVSDSGGVQEECTVLQRPLIVLRNSTERPEAIDAGFARRVVPGPELGTVLDEALADSAWAEGLAQISSPYGDGSASHRIVAAIEQLLERTDGVDPRAAA